MENKDSNNLICNFNHIKNEDNSSGSISDQVNFDDISPIQPLRLMEKKENKKEIIRNNLSDRNHHNETERYGQNFDKFSNNSKSECYNNTNNDWVSQVSQTSKKNDFQDNREMKNKKVEIENSMIDNIKNYDLDEVVRKVEADTENKLKEEINEVILSKQKKMSESKKLKVDVDEIVEEEKKMESDFVDTELPWI